MVTAPSLDMSPATSTREARRCSKPTSLDRPRVLIRLKAIKMLMLSRVDLYLQLELAAAVSLGSEPECQVHRVLDLLPLGFSEPGEGLAHSINRRPDGFRLRLNQINIFRIAERFGEQKLVNGRAAAKGDLSLQRLAVKEVAERTTDNQVLLDLPEIRPGRTGAPLPQVGNGDQASIST